MGKCKTEHSIWKKSIFFLLSHPSKLQEGKTNSGLRRTKTLQVLTDFTSVLGFSDKYFGKTGEWDLSGLIKGRPGERCWWHRNAPCLKLHWWWEFTFSCDWEKNCQLPQHWDLSQYTAHEEKKKKSLIYIFSVLTMKCSYLTYLQERLN